MPREIDILEDRILQLSPELLDTLLLDRTKSREGDPCNIFWGTKDYAHRGEGYQYGDPITPSLITADNGHVIMPRVLKAKDKQTARSKDMAEVFTPSWICNTQNNLVDEAWFGRKDVFNTELDDHTWTATTQSISFPEGKTWRDYIRSTRLEITCGEAPYIVSRYDATTAEPIAIPQRIGLLDRKLRIVGENTANKEEWIAAATTAYQHIYAYEWQGDNLLLARESMLITFIEYYEDKFGEEPPLQSLQTIAEIISWNVWQMDGLKGTIPDSCHDVTTTQTDLFGTQTQTVTHCEGCAKNDLRRHNGIYCLIRDWEQNETIRFIDTIQE